MIKTNHFFISYAGNKRRECDTIYKEIKELDNVWSILTSVTALERQLDKIS